MAKFTIGLSCRKACSPFRGNAEPLTDASHVKNALARFDQVEGVSDSDRELAFANIKKAAQYYGVDVKEKSWRELGRR